MKLKLRYSTIITPTLPFHFDSTFHKPDHFTTADHIFKSSTRWQATRWMGVPLGAKISATTNNCVLLEIYCNKDQPTLFYESFITEFRYRFNLDLDLTEFYQMAPRHERLAKAVRNLYGMRPGHPNSLYEYLMITIVLQNATVKRSIQMFLNLLSGYGEKLIFDEQQLYCLWQPGAFLHIPEQELRDLKIGYRAKSIKRLDQEFAQNKIDEMSLRIQPTNDVKAALLSLYGVGPASVWYLMFDIFHRWDSFEHISPWEQKLYSQLFLGRDLTKLASVNTLMAFINQFGKYKHLAVHYLWEDLWWRRQQGEFIPWLEAEIRS